MWLKRYMHWLHTQWPAGTVEPLPVVNADGTTNVPNLYIVGDLTGIPLLKFAADSGARAVQHLVDRTDFANSPDDEVLDLIIVGGSVSGMAAALEARKHGLRFEVLEAEQPFATIVNFPRGKPIFTYPTDMEPAGAIHFTERSSVKEGLLDELRDLTVNAGITPRLMRVDHVERRGGVFEIVPTDGSSGAQLRARYVIIAIGRSGDHRRLNVPGEDRDHVYNRLHDPADFAGREVLVVGGGDSALEASAALADAGARTTLSYRKAEFSRPKAENIERYNALARSRKTQLRPLIPSTVQRIDSESVVLKDDRGDEQTIPNDAVFTMLGRDAPLGFLRRSGVRIAGDWRAGKIAGLVVFLMFCLWLYHWKKTGVTIAPFPPFDWIAHLGDWWAQHGWFPYNVPNWWAGLGACMDRPANVLGTMRITLGEPGFYYSLVYCLCVVLFGIDRIRRRRTPYIKWQTITLICIQCIPLFLLPYILLPWMGNNGWFDSGTGKWLADQLFPLANYGHGREYWRAFGFILAWPLFIWNLFSDQQLMLWLLISCVQTFVIIPLIVWRWGKGAYCGWICSCGALAETMGDRHRHKMPHGPKWNKANMIGQVFLVFAMLLLLLRAISWGTPTPFEATVVSTVGDTEFDINLTLPAGRSATEARYARFPESEDRGRRTYQVYDSTSSSITLFADAPGPLTPGQRVEMRPLFTSVHEWSTGVFNGLMYKLPFFNYVWFVDLFWAGIIGVGMYFWFSGRVWCRFACPLAALMHIYARFSRFRIFAEKSKCISCNVCTSVCHQGIDVMNFANKGRPMEDPQCVRCSACVQSCPTGVLHFGRVGLDGSQVFDPLVASPLHLVELRVGGRRMT